MMIESPKGYDFDTYKHYEDLMATARAKGMSATLPSWWPEYQQKYKSLYDNQILRLAQTGVIAGMRNKFGLV